MVKTAYFYGKESDQFAFITMPKVLFDDPDYRDLACEAKVLYGMMLDRMSLSIKNDWYDEEGKAYIRIAEDFVMDKLCCGRNKALSLMKQLEKFDLIERKKLGQGKTSIIYVKRFIKEDEVENNTVEEIASALVPTVEDKYVTAECEESVDQVFVKIENQTSDEEYYEPQSQKFENQTSEENDGVSEVYNLNFKKFKNQTSRSLDFKHLEVYFSNPNNTNINNNNYNNTKSNLILSTESEDVIRCDENQTMEAYARIIQDNIDFDHLLLAHPYDRELLEGIHDMILEILVSKSDEILIASERYPASLVKSKFMKLNYMHIEYVLSCFKSNTTRVKNIKKYILATLFNAPTTMDGYYSAAVQHDMPQFVV